MGNWTNLLRRSIGERTAGELFFIQRDTNNTFKRYPICGLNLERSDDIDELLAVAGLLHLGNMAAPTVGNAGLGDFR